MTYPARRLMLATAAAATALARVASSAAQTPAPATPRIVPARPLPAPDTISPQLRVHVAPPPAPGWDMVPKTAEEWRGLVAATTQAVMPDVARLRADFRLTVTPTRIAGVPVFDIVPADIAPENRDRVLMHLHGGGYVFFPGEAGAGEGMLMAGHGRIRVVSVDYRMPPDHPFPAALDDALAVWRALLAQHNPARMGVFGSSAGGGLTLALMLHARASGVALPAAIAPGTPWVDLAGDGDSRNANAFVDNVLVSDSGWIGAAAKLYAGGRDLRDPLVSPIHGDFAGLPPALITTGTRDLLLSDAVRTHRKLRQAGVEALLQVFEAQSHAQFLLHAAPETEEAFAEISAFFARHLTR